jgi:D-alanine transaminase
MKDLGYYNGEFGPIDEMRIPMNDRVCWFGDGVYDATISVNYRIFLLNEHIDRFFNSMALIGIEAPLSKAELADILTGLVRKVDSPTQFVYWQMTRGVANRAHAFPEAPKPALWVTLRPHVLRDLHERVALVTVPDTRYLHCNIKTLNLLPNVLASEVARKANCYEAVFYRGDRVTECAHSSLSIIKDGALITPPLDELILPSITRAHVLSHCRKLGIRTAERPFSLEEMFQADEVLVSSSGAFVVPVEKIDDRAVGGRAPELLDKLTDALFTEYMESANG